MAMLAAASYIRPLSLHSATRARPAVQPRMVAMTDIEVDVANEFVIRNTSRGDIMLCYVSVKDLENGKVPTPVPASMQPELQPRMAAMTDEVDNANEFIIRDTSRGDIMMCYVNVK